MATFVIRARWAVWPWLFCLALLSACAEPWNNPYRAEEARANVLYSAFSERPKHLDPARSYSSNEYARVTLLDAAGRVLPPDAPAGEVAESVYEIRILPGIRYQPHPALARDGEGRYRYHALRPEDVADIHTLGDFPETGTRELVAEDYVYQIKRLADPRVHSPIFGLMAEYIVGLRGGWRWWTVTPTAFG